MVFPNIIITDKGVQFTLDYIKKKTYRQIYIEFFFFFGFNYLFIFNNNNKYKIRKK